MPNVIATNLIALFYVGLLFRITCKALILVLKEDTSIIKLGIIRLAKKRAKAKLEIDSNYLCQGTLGVFISLNRVSTCSSELIIKV